MISDRFLPKIFTSNFKGIFVVALLLVMGCETESTETEIKWTDRLDNYEDWGIYRGDKKANQYSTFDQININNVHQLEPAWEYHHGDPEGPGIYSNPIIIDGLLYFTTPRVHAVALNAETGEEVWRFKPSEYNDGEIFRGRNRGLVYWEDQDGNHQRIFNFVKDRVYAIDADTGELIESFGENGFIDLRKNLPVDPETASIEVTTPGIVYQNFLIVPSRVPEGNNTTPGDIRAYNTLTGEFEWIFHTVPQEGEFGYDTWEHEEGMQYGGANPWGGLTVDEDRGWVFAATGSAAGEFVYGGSRKGRNLFSSTVLALDATTGERQWHYQVIRHDIFDYDLPPAPILATIKKEDGETRDLVVQMTKMGLTFVLDRDTGEPVFPVMDLPVPESKVPGEEAWPTQPFPLLPPPLTRLQVLESDLTNITPESHASALKQFKQHETGYLYTPASLAGVITMPGHQGGVEWGGGAFDPNTNVLYVNANELPTIHTLKPLPPDNILEEDMTPVQRGANIYNGNCTACHGLNRKGNPPLYPPLTNIQLSTDSLHSVLKQGRGIMPSFSHFDDEQINDLVAYLESNEEITTTDLSTSEINDSTLTWSGPDSSWTTTTPQYAQITPFFEDHMGYPAIKPPWGTLNAVDLESGQILWKVPLGEYPELVDMGIRNTGTRNFGGPVLTAGNLVFIAATMDEKIRAFDKFTGEILWEHQLPAGGYATPSVYKVDGKQYVVIAAGGGGKPGTEVGDSIIAFSLPGSEVD